MPIYKYKYTKDGEEKEETGEFTNKADLYSHIRTSKGSVVFVEEAKKGFLSKNISLFNRKIKPQEQINFTKNLSVMIEAGLTVSRSLSILQKQSKNKRLTSIIEDIMDLVNSGETLSKALETKPNIFSNLFVSMTRAGEESGKLSYTLKMVSDQLEKSFLLSKKIKGAMIYPAVILSVMIVISVILMVYMVPTLTETFKGLNISLPLPTRIIIHISDFLRMNIILTFLSILLFFGSVFYFFRTKGGKNFLDNLVLHIPMISTISKEINSARTSRTLASLISSGVDVVSALNITSNVVQNHNFKGVLEESSKKVEMGETLSSSLSDPKNNLYPVFVSEMLSVGEETGKMTEMLNNIAVYYEGEVDQKTKDLSTIIEPFLMVVIGVAVGVFAIAMMLPTYSLVDSIK